MATSGCASRLPIPAHSRGPFALANVWLNVEVDKESPATATKTSTVGGRKIHEKWSKDSKRGEVQMVVGNRFMVD